MNIWRISDTRPGHDSQSLGLTMALADCVPCTINDLAAPAPFESYMDFIFKNQKMTAELPAPDLIIGAGHRTHLPMLNARRIFGGKIVVLMKPTLPFSWFDLCLVPEHDSPAHADNIITTRGALNCIRPANARRTDLGLILVGGPSRHYHWDDQDIEQQITRVLDDRHIQWHATDSPRTPINARQMLRSRRESNFHYHAFSDTPRGWLAAQRDITGITWISEDSVSMVYETLSSGAATGVLRVPYKQAGRLQQGIEHLVRDGLVTRFEDWAAGQALNAHYEPLNESARCAQQVLERFYRHTSFSSQQN